MLNFGAVVGGENGSYIISNFLRYLEDHPTDDPYDIPLNPGWLIGLLIVAYFNPNIIG